jgi:hypothetical protein
MQSSEATKSKKRGKNEAAQQRRYEHSVVSKKPTKAAKEPRKKKDQKNALDASIDKRRAREMGVTISTERESLECRKRKRDQENSVTQLLPQRGKQTREALSIRANRTPSAPRPSQRVESGAQEGELYKQLVGVNAFLHKQRNETASPLEELACLGLLSSQALPVNEKQARMASQLEADAEFMRRQLEQLSRAEPSATPPQNTMLLTKVSRTPQGKKAVLVKLGLLFGTLNYAFGYERRASYDHKEYVKGASERDLQERRERFFLRDALEEETPFGSPPCRFKMFRELQAENLERYRGRGTAPVRDSASVPRSDLEMVNRAYIAQFRRRPRDGEQTCFKGTRCLFYTARTDHSLRYVGRAFFTEKQVAAWDASPETLCIDCLLQKWTLQCLDNIANELPQTVPINHFSVIVGAGEYSTACMLPVEFNELETGIVGYVPFYDEKFRHMVVSGTPPESYIAEIGMDF